MACSPTALALLILGDAINPANQTLTSLVALGFGTNAVVGGNSTLNSTLTLNNSAAVTYAGNLGGSGANQNNLALTMTGDGRVDA